MKSPLFKFTFAILGAAAAIFLVLFFVRGSSSAVAQETQDLWLSSAEPPEGTPLEAMSPPDQHNRQPHLPDETSAIDDLISHRVTGSALRPRESVVNFSNNSSGGCIYAVDSASSVFNTPIWLEQGSFVDTLRMYYNDTSANNSTAWFTIYDLYGDIVEEWSVSSAGDAGNSFNDSTVISHTVDYSVYSYLLNWRPVVAGSSMQLCGFRIFYETPPLPFGIQLLPTVPNDL